MKKSFAILIIAALIIYIFIGCINKFEESTTYVPEETKLKTFYLDEKDLFTMYLHLYSKKSEAESFISGKEASIYLSNNFNIVNYKDGLVAYYDTITDQVSKYYYTILLTDPLTEETVIGYTNKHGVFCIYNITQEYTITYGNIHVPEGTEYIDSKSTYSVVHTNNSVEIWKFGKKTDEVNIPNNSIYAGYSDCEGYIFRYGGDVYSLTINQNENGDTDILFEAIAHDVKKVIVADYKLNPDALSQPLFLMKDGSIKAYSILHGNKDSSKDDSSHLAHLQFEGGWK